MNYKIFTDSASNLRDEDIERLNVEVLSLVFIIDGKEVLSYVKGQKNDNTYFYDILKEKKPISTSCVNTSTFYDAFLQALENGEDVLYIGLSSNVSQTYQCAVDAMTQLKEIYPDRKMVAVDSKGASFGIAIMVEMASKMRSEEKSIEEVKDYIESIKLSVCHFYTVDDLYWFHKGGRIKKSAYYLAVMGKIKPLLIASNEGKIESVGKVIGRRRSLNWLVEKIVSNVKEDVFDTVYIAHGNCVDDAITVKEKVLLQKPNLKIETALVDPVLGIHAGPGFMATFFVGTNR